MKNMVNTYFAALIITIAGAFATLIIINIAGEDTFANFKGSEAVYTELQQSILK